MKPDRYEPEDAQEQQDYEKEFTYGINWNTNGGIIGGINCKFAWQLKDNQRIYNLIGLEIVHVVHPKEATRGTYFGSYTYGKSNNLFVIRPQFGREWLIFKKAEEEGIQVTGILAGGPSLAYMKPYYVLAGDSIQNAEPVQYSLDVGKNKNVYSNSSFFYGFDEMTANLGIHAKASLNFEYSQFKSSVAGIEVGALFEVYARKLIIIPEAESSSFFPSLFVNVYFGTLSIKSFVEG